MKNIKSKDEIFIDKFNELENDYLRWVLVVESVKTHDIEIVCDNDYTMINCGEFGSSFSSWLGNTNGIFDLMKSLNITARQV